MRPCGWSLRSATGKYAFLLLVRAPTASSWLTREGAATLGNPAFDPAEFPDRLRYALYWPIVSGAEYLGP